MATRPADNRVVPALAGRSLALVVPRPFVTDADERLRAQRRYLDPATTPEERRGIEDEHDVRFVLLRTDRRDRTLLAGLRAEGATVVAEDDGRILLHVPPPLQPVFDE